jgi:predicted Zn-dependent protease
MTVINRLAMLSLLLAALHAADAPRTIPAEAATLLTDLAEAEPAEVVTRIDGYHGPTHPFITLRLAQARWRLSQDTADAQARGALLAAAEADFRAVIAADPSLTQAQLGIAQCAAARDDWITACRTAAAAIDPGHADRGQITFLASTALRAGDWRLATLASQHGILRFPDDTALRRIELAVLVHADRGEDARQAVLALLAQTPDDADLWQHLAWSAQQTGRDDEMLAAREAALTVRPADRTLRRQLAEAQLGHGMPQAALATVAPLLSTPPTAQELADEGLVLLACRAAADSGDIVRARTWLAGVPEAQRTRSLRLQAARLAIRAGDESAASAALDALVALGERDPAVLTWAAALAESRGDLARAEALFIQAIGAEKTGNAAAALRLAALYLRQERRDEAATVLATHLAKFPDDAQARALQARLDRTRR